MVLEQAGESFVTATMVSSRGHAPQDPGAKILITKQGRYWGTIGGGKLESRVIKKARELVDIHGQAPLICEWNLALDIGMSCGGVVEILFEVHQPAAWRICIFGAGHISQALIRTLIPLPCRIQVFDSRTEWLDRLPQTSNLQTYSRPADSTAIGSLSPNGYFLVMTMGHATDLPVLNEIFKQHPRAPYIGVIGSSIKARKMSFDLLQLGHSTNTVAALHCPMGLKVGSNHPHEIAISIAAELLETRDRQKFDQKFDQNRCRNNLGSADQQSPEPSQCDAEPTSV
jgi:xanthine dehydrogenase accessory factor